MRLLCYTSSQTATSARPQPRSQGVDWAHVRPNHIAAAGFRLHFFNQDRMSKIIAFPIVLASPRPDGCMGSELKPSRDVCKMCVVATYCFMSALRCCSDGWVQRYISICCGSPVIGLGAIKIKTKI